MLVPEKRGMDLLAVFMALHVCQRMGGNPAIYSCIIMYGNTELTPAVHDCHRYLQFISGYCFMGKL